MELSSEFASVRLTIDHAGNGPRVRLEDCLSGRVVHFDPLELEFLTWCTPEDIAVLLGSAFERWSHSLPADGLS